jgi:CRP-like cAMP-binding protein
MMGKTYSWLSLVNYSIKFILLGYYLFSISFRLAFRFPIVFAKQYSTALTIDYLVDIFYIIDFFVSSNVFSYLKRSSSIPRIGRSTFILNKNDGNESRAETYQRINNEVEMSTLNRTNSSATITTSTQGSFSSDAGSSRKSTRKSYLNSSKFNFDEVLNKYEILLNEAAINAKKTDSEMTGLNGGESKILKWLRETWSFVSSTIVPFINEFIMLFPFELIAYILGYEYYYLFRIPRIWRIIYSKEYFYGILDVLDKKKVVSGPSTQRVLLLTVIMLVLAHFGACVFYAIALSLLDRSPPVRNNWLVNDGMVEFIDGSDDYYFTKQLKWRYVRSLYWSVVTSQTVGFGDIVPVDILETTFVLCFFYVSHVLAQLAIGNLILMVNVYDSAHTKYRDQINKLDKYSHFRSLPPELKDRIKSFYEHQWKVLNGMDEDQFLNELPFNVKTKVRQATIRDLLKTVSELKNLRVAILNALVEDVKTLMYSPHDTIVSAGSISRGMYIILRGEACIDLNTEQKLEIEDESSVENQYFDDEYCDNSDSKSGNKSVKITQALVQGESFGSHGLLNKFPYAATLSAGSSVCEVLFLSRSRFNRTCSNHMSDEEYVELKTGFISGVTETVIEKLKDIPQVSPKIMRRAAIIKKHSHIPLGIINAIDSHKRDIWFGFLKPDSSYRISWDNFIFLCIIFYAISIPYLFSHSFDPTFYVKDENLLILCYMVDIIMLLDLGFRSSLFPYVVDGVKMDKFRDIWTKYKNTENIMYEILSNIPFDLLSIIVGVQFIPLIRFMKIFHLRRLYIYWMKFERFIEINLKLSISFESRRFIKLYFALFNLCHWAGCFYQVAADFSIDVLDNETNWKINDAILRTESLSVQYDGMWGNTAYRRSIYWAINAMATSGSCDMRASNMFEMLFVSFTLVLGCQTINAVLGSIASLMASVNVEKRDFQAKNLMVDKILKCKEVPLKLNDSIVNFFAYNHTRSNGSNEVEILAGLPVPLREAVVKHIAGSVLVKIPFFSNCIEPMLKMILGLLKHRLFLTGDDVVIAGEYGKEMFVLESGVIIVTSADKKITYATLKSGAYIGESCLLKVTKRTASAYAKDYCETYVLSKHDFALVMEAFPGEKQIIIDGITEVLDQKANKNRLTALTLKTPLGLKRNEGADEESDDEEIVSNINGEGKKSDQNHNSPVKSVESEHNIENQSINSKILLKPVVSEHFPKVLENIKKILPVIRDTVSPSTPIIVKPKSRSPSPEETIVPISDSKRYYNRSRKSILDWNYTLGSKSLLLGSVERKIWDSVLFLILIYNLFMIPLRIALDLEPWGYAVDYFFDLILIYDSYLHAFSFCRIIRGKQVFDRDQLRLFYMQNSFKEDFFARFPFEILLVFFRIFLTSSECIKILCYFRVTKLFLVIRGTDLVAQAESALEQFLDLKYMAIRLLEVFIAMVFIGHWLGCGLFMFSKVHLGEACVNEPNAFYGTACQYKDTWIQFMIMTGKLPEDGGSQYSRYLRSLNWSIPTMVLYVVGDVYPVNLNETTYLFISMFFGIAMNALIVGSIITLVAGMDEDQAAMRNQYEILRDHLFSKGVSKQLIEKVSSYMRFMQTNDGQLLKMEALTYKEFPHSLKVSMNIHTKLKFFKNCPFFDFCTEEVLRSLCMVMVQQIFYTGDTIISFGDLGQEMFFIESGRVEVIGNDGLTVLATVNAGGFFGETAIVFRRKRTANIRAACLCVCYSLTKDDLDNELKDCDFDVDATIQSLIKLQDSNTRRNSAVTKNLTKAADPRQKLHKLLGPSVKIESGYVANILNPNGIFKFLLDIFGLLFVFYYCFSVPFDVAFIFGEYVEQYRSVMVMDFVVDSLCIIEFIIRLCMYDARFDTQKSIAISGKSSSTKYLYATSYPFISDLISIIPLELLVLIPGINFSTIFSLRLIHLVRIVNILKRIRQVEDNLSRIGMTFHRQKMMVFKSISAYVLVNHWIACIFFCAHRYLERHESLTWVTHDHFATFNTEKGRHNICNQDSNWLCYQRSVYFVGTVLTSVGYGDVSAYTDLEVIMYVALCIISACLGANICGQMSSLLSTQDKSGETSYKDKVRAVEHYIGYRKLRSDLRQSILTNINTIWVRERRIGDASSSFLSYLPVPLAADVAYELNNDIVMAVPIFSTIRDSLRRKLSLFLKAQILSPNTPVYGENDTGHCIFFILLGKIQVKSARDRESLNSAGILSLKLLDQKHLVFGDILSRGHHFGEYCLLSKSGLRPDNSFALELTEVYYYDKLDIKTLFLQMPFAEKYGFVMNLFSCCGDVEYVKNIAPSAFLEKEFEGNSLTVMHSMCMAAAEDVLEAQKFANRRKQKLEVTGEEDGEESSSTDSNADEDDGGDLTLEEWKEKQLQLRNAREEEQKNPNTNRRRLVRRMSIGSVNSDEDVEPSDTLSRWSEALAKHEKEIFRRKSIHNHVNKLVITNTDETTSVVYVDDNEVDDELRKRSLEEKVRALFLYIDKDDSGTIDREEIMISLGQLGLDRKWNDVDKMINFADADGNREIDIEELVQAVLKEADKEREEELEAEEEFKKEKEDTIQREKEYFAEKDRLKQEELSRVKIEELSKLGKNKISLAPIGGLPNTTPVQNFPVDL